MSAGQLLISAPGLERWLQAPDELPGSLKPFFARAQSMRLQGDLPIVSALGISNLPAAPLCRLAQKDNDAFDGHWLRFDPIALLPDLTAVWIQSRVTMNMGEDSSAALVDEFQQMFQAEGIDWQPNGAGRYGLIRLNSTINAEFIALDRVIGRRLNEVLPSGEDATRWRSMLNESQMIFHQFRSLDHPGQQGMGLWFWGAGCLPKDAPSIGDAVMVCAPGADHLSDEWYGLARWLKIELIEQSEYQPFSGTSLIDAGMMDSEAELQKLEQRWIQPAWAALASGKLHDLNLIDGDRAWQVRRFDRWAFWRRNRLEHRLEQS